MGMPQLIVTVALVEGRSKNEVAPQNDVLRTGQDQRRRNLLLKPARWP